MGIGRQVEKIVCFGHPGKRVTSEWEIYWEILNKRPDINAILHGHDIIVLETAEQLFKNYPVQVSLTKGITGSGSPEFRYEIPDIVLIEYQFLFNWKSAWFFCFR
jgi:hypothetical protein